MKEKTKREGKSRAGERGGEGEGGGSTRSKMPVDTKAKQALALGRSHFFWDGVVCVFLDSGFVPRVVGGTGGLWSGQIVPQLDGGLT